MVKTYQYARVVGYRCQNNTDMENLVRGKEVVKFAGPEFLRDSIGTGIRVIINLNFRGILRKGFTIRVRRRYTMLQM